MDASIVVLSALIVLILALLGGSIASFLGVLAERPLRNESINSRSHCACGRQLKNRENIPLLGWLRVRGVAKCCGARIPARYVISEAVLAVVYAIALGAAFFSVVDMFPSWGIPSGLIVASLSTVGVFFWLRKAAQAA